MNEHIVKALDIIEDGLLIVNKDYQIEYCNKPAQKLLRQDSLLGKQSYEAIWGRKTMEGKSPSFMSFETDEVASAERIFEDGTCLLVRSHPLDKNHLVLTIWDVSDYISLENRLKRSGNDPTTNFRTNSSFGEELEKELDRSKRTRSNLVLTLIEIGFPVVESEDTHTQLLKDISDIIVTTARNYDMIFRLHGDTFAVIMPHCVEDAAKKTNERMLEIIRKSIGNINVSIGISGSASAFTGRDVIRLAERALYVAKHKGGNTSVIG